MIYAARRATSRRFYKNIALDMFVCITLGQDIKPLRLANAVDAHPNNKQNGNQWMLPGVEHCAQSQLPRFTTPKRQKG